MKIKKIKQKKRVELQNGKGKKAKQKRKIETTVHGSKLGWRAMIKQ